MLYANFLFSSSDAMLPLVTMAARTLRAPETTEDEEKHAWLHSRVNPQLLNTWTFDLLTDDGGVCRRDSIWMLALLGRFAGANVTVGTMTDEEMAAWRNSMPARELMAFADKRYEIACHLHSFQTEWRKLWIGEYRGVPVFTEVRIDHPKGLEPKLEEEWMNLARHYIDAAFSLIPDFKSEGFSVDYGRNNLRYLAQEYKDTRTIYRVLVPFLPTLPQIEAAKNTALTRGLYEPPPEDWQMTPEVLALLALLPAEPPIEE